MSLQVSSLALSFIKHKNKVDMQNQDYLIALVVFAILFIAARIYFLLKKEKYVICITEPKNNLHLLGIENMGAFTVGKIYTVLKKEPYTYLLQDDNNLYVYVKKIHFVEYFDKKTKRK